MGGTPCGRRIAILFGKISQVFCSVIFSKRVQSRLGLEGGAVSFQFDFPFRPDLLGGIPFAGLDDENQGDPNDYGDRGGAHVIEGHLTTNLPQGLRAGQRRNTGDDRGEDKRSDNHFQRTDENVASDQVHPPDGIQRQRVFRSDGAIHGHADDQADNHGNKDLIMEADFFHVIFRISWLVGLVESDLAMSLPP